MAIAKYKDNDGTIKTLNNITINHKISPLFQYRKLEWIKGNHKIFFDTHYVINNKTKIEFEFKDDDDVKECENYFGGNGHNGIQLQRPYASSDGSINENYLAVIGGSKISSSYIYSGFSCNFKSKRILTFDKTGFYNEIGECLRSFTLNITDPDTIKTLLIFSSWRTDDKYDIDNVGQFTFYSMKIYEDGILIHKYVPILDGIERICLLDEITEDLIYPKARDNKEFSMAKGDFEIGPVTETVIKDQWMPELDWWNIKQVLEEDRENYPGKVIYLFTDSNSKSFNLTNMLTGNYLKAEKVKFSDGQSVLKTETDKFNLKLKDNAFKQCSKGYKTAYIILYFNNRKINYGYYNLLNLGGNSFETTLWIYMKGIDTLGYNSSWNTNAPYLQSWESDMVLNFPQSNCTNRLGAFYNIKNLPKCNFKSTMATCDFNSMPTVKKKQLLNYVGDGIKSEYHINGESIVKFNGTMWGEILDLEEFGIDPSKVKRYDTILGPYSIKWIDMTSCTVNVNQAFQVYNIDKVTNITRSTNNFSNSRLNHDTLVRVLNALADYSSDTSGNTYTLTLTNNNLNKLSEEEIKIGTDKGWTIV